MKTLTSLFPLSAACFILAVSSNALATDMLVTTSEGANSVNSTLANTYAETFDNLSIGKNNNVSWNGVGTFDSLNIKAGDVYGGAHGSQYAVEGLSGNSAVAKTTLSLNQSSGYFGMWWSAGDAANKLDFYSGNSLVASFTTKTLTDNLPSAYNGNPFISASAPGGNDSSEKFGFINFIGDANTSWDSIVFSNNGSSGFEGDNYTSRVNGWNPTTDGALPGTPLLELKNGVTTLITALPAGFAVAAPGAPAPPLTACLAFAAIIVLQTLRKKTS